MMRMKGLARMIKREMRSKTAENNVMFLSFSLGPRFLELTARLGILFPELLAAVLVLTSFDQ
jgi:hypothetical protein